MGGDSIVLQPAANGVLGGPNSPLVVYGDTSQDGLWYSGDPATVDGREFGDKPFNPFSTCPTPRTRTTSGSSRSADRFRLHGNDVIDASALFAGAAAAALPDASA